eukprot:NODE_7412_length_1580_cov_7.108052.p1 GENE.NODE_7412_length_1580_cov_7.108052~~NODE_7412_length_1580_cov_7.108052.p1  ORF type:complete len:421 (-),score=123.32 NODE_7412_length_1580_cov_7.108052:148-1410(-)
MPHPDVRDAMLDPAPPSTSSGTDEESESGGDEEEEDDESVACSARFSRYGSLVRPDFVSPHSRSELRLAARAAPLGFERRDGYVRPPKELNDGARCVISTLGECGDRRCGNYRLGRRTAPVRRDFLEYCLAHIRRAWPDELLRSGVNFCSLGSGQLLFDWELLEALTHGLRARLRVVQLIDKEYGPRGRSDARRAQRTFAGWFAAEQRGCRFRSFDSTSALSAWIKRTGESAHVLLDCDAVGARRRLDINRFRRTVLLPGGVCLVLSNPAKRTALVKAKCPEDGALTVVDQQYYSHGVWTERRPRTSTISRSRRRRRTRSRSRSRWGCKERRERERGNRRREHEARKCERDTCEREERERVERARRDREHAETDRRQREREHEREWRRRRRGGSESRGSSRSRSRGRRSTHCMRSRRKLA